MTGIGGSFVPLKESQWSMLANPKRDTNLWNCPRSVKQPFVELFLFEIARSCTAYLSLVLLHSISLWGCLPSTLDTRSQMDASNSYHRS